MDCKNSESPCGVPCSPNRHLDKLRIVGQVDLSRRQIQRDSLSNIRPGLVLSLTGGCATGKSGHTAE